MKFDYVILEKNLNKWNITLPDFVRFVDSMDVMRNLQSSGVENNITKQRKIFPLLGHY